MAPLHFHSALQMAELIRRREISPLELTQVHLERASALHPTLNAFSQLDAERAMVQARDAERRILRGAPAGPLLGVPVTIKSSVDVAGLPCACGSALRRDYVPSQDAPLVARLKSAGAILLGNTNVPEYLMAYETDNSLYGMTRNPWDLSRTPGGSSGGEAAAIASGCSAAGVGSDGGGSIRVPAHFTGICGLKPTPGRVPLSGHFPPPGGALTWIGVVGPMARTVSDLRMLFEILSGPDAGDPCAAPVVARRPSSAETQGLRIGVLESAALGTPTPGTLEAVDRAARALSDQGYPVEPAPLRGLDQALDLWWFFFGPAIAYLLRKMTVSQEASLSPMLQGFLAVTASEPPVTLDRFVEACAERDVCRTYIVRQFQKASILLSPVSAGPAFRHGEGNWGTECGAGAYRQAMRHCQWLNLAGLPGAVVPVGNSPDGLPIGVQVIGAPFQDELVLEVAEHIEQACGGWRQPAI